MPTKKDFDLCMKWPQFESALKTGSSSADSDKAMTKEICPSFQVLDTIKQLGSIADGHETVLDNIQGLQVRIWLVNWGNQVIQQQVD